MGPLQDHPPDAVDFFEVAPENWIGVGGRLGKQFRHFTERYPFVATACRCPLAARHHWMKPSCSASSACSMNTGSVVTPNT